MIWITILFFLHTQVLCDNPEIILFYNCEQLIDDVVPDLSGNGFHGSLLGALTCFFTQFITLIYNDYSDFF